ncbi:hypothetical protein [Reyranella sp.]|uniref:hypothetical protein n=1 Tax=Reyranella sp. TaxID=1929291 RepID=UPI003C7DA8AB
MFSLDVWLRCVGIAADPNGEAVWLFIAPASPSVPAIHEKRTVPGLDAPTPDALPMVLRDNHGE